MKNRVDKVLCSSVYDSNFGGSFIDSTFDRMSPYRESPKVNHDSNNDFQLINSNGLSPENTSGFLRIRLQIQGHLLTNLCPAEAAA